MLETLAASLFILLLKFLPVFHFFLAQKGKALKLVGSQIAFGEMVTNRLHVYTQFLRGLFHCEVVRVFCFVYDRLRFHIYNIQYLLSCVKKYFEFVCLVLLALTLPEKISTFELSNVAA